MRIRTYNLDQWLLRKGIHEKTPLLHVLNSVMFHDAIKDDLECIHNKFLFITRCGVTDEMLIAFEDVSDE